jgi:hypothetical protein
MGFGDGGLACVVPSGRHTARAIRCGRPAMVAPAAARARIAAGRPACAPSGTGFRYLNSAVCYASLHLPALNSHCRTPSSWIDALLTSWVEVTGGGRKHPRTYRKGVEGPGVVEVRVWRAGRTIRRYWPGQRRRRSTLADRGPARTLQVLPPISSHNVIVGHLLKDRSIPAGG